MTKNRLELTIRFIEKYAPSEFQIALIGKAALMESTGLLKASFTNEAAIKSFSFRLRDYVLAKTENGHSREGVFQHLHKRIKDKTFEEIVTGVPSGSPVRFQKIPEHIAQKSFMPDTHIILHSGVPVLTMRFDRIGTRRHIYVQSASKLLFGQHIGIKERAPAEGHMGWKTINTQMVYDDIAQALEREFAPSSLSYRKYSAHRDCGTTYENRLGATVLTKDGFKPMGPDLNAEILGSLTLLPKDTFDCLMVEESVTITGTDPQQVMDISKGSLATPSLIINNASVKLSSVNTTVNKLTLLFSTVEFTDSAPDTLLSLSLSQSTVRCDKVLTRMFIDDISVRKSQGIIAKSVRANRGYSDGSAVVASPAAIKIASQEKRVAESSTTLEHPTCSESSTSRSQVSGPLP